MDNLAQLYSSSIAALGVFTLLMLLQILAADVVGIMRKHPPGTPVAADHGNALFRVVRTVANTNESVAVFLGGLLFCVLSSASPQYTAYAAWAYVLARAFYTICYYANLQVLRSIGFGFSLLALAALLIVGAFTG